jgi:hypothetical protein
LACGGCDSGCRLSNHRACFGDGALCCRLLLLRILLLLLLLRCLLRGLLLLWLLWSDRCWHWWSG